MKPANPHILTINGGSSSIKFVLFEAGDSLPRILGGWIERIALPEATFAALKPWKNIACRQSARKHPSPCPHVPGNQISLTSRFRASYPAVTSDGAHPASIFVDWDSVDNAVYELQWFSDAPLTQMAGTVTVTVSEYEVTGLTKGNQYWFCVRAVRSSMTGRALVRSGDAGGEYLEFRTLWGVK